MKEVQKADPAARRRSLVLTLLSAPLVGTVIYLLDGSPSVVERWLDGNPTDSTGRIWILLSFMALAIVIPAGVAALWAWRLGRRVGEAHRFPPPGMAVIRDTRVWTGWAADRIAWFFQVTAVVVSGLAVAACVLLWRVANLILSGP